MQRAEEEEKAREEESEDVAVDFIVCSVVSVFF